MSVGRLRVVTERVGPRARDTPEGDVGGERRSSAFPLEAFNRGDIERCLDFWRDDLELVVSEALPEPGRYLGRDAAAAWFGSYFRSFEPGYAFRMEEIIEVAGDVVVIAAHHGIGRRSGVEISGESAYLYGVG